MTVHEFMRGWPASLVEIAEVIGTGPTLNLVDAFRGLDYCYVPKSVEPDHRVTQAIGIEAATKLVKEFGTVNEIDCRDPNKLLVGELTNWRVQQLTLSRSK